MASNKNALDAAMQRINQPSHLDVLNGQIESLESAPVQALQDHARKIENMGFQERDLPDLLQKAKRSCLGCKAGHEDKMASRCLSIAAKIELVRRSRASAAWGPEVGTASASLDVHAWPAPSN